ncbi:MAG TPA: tetratricopeptide repeat protein, partial [Verrucomicrobiae bacterium]|nr:tetratricopeptide repeat protein [Verrucomicrobiae bacterium]
GWHHIVSVLFHAVNSVLLFFLLIELTARVWLAFFVAALFAWHPLHIESVAWVSERKDVLSTCLGLLAMLTYARFAKTEPGRMRRKYYLLTCVLFTLALLAKPMLVTLPFLLLLLDYWPLRRAGWRGLLVEKIPLFILSAASCVVTLWAQNTRGAVVSTNLLPMSLRLANAVWACCWYVAKLAWPADLTVYYPYVNPPLGWAVWVPALALVAVTVIVLRLRQCLCLTVGWLWFVGTLVPVIGLVQVGSQGMADRYSYLPSVGLFIAVVFGLTELAGRFPQWRKGLAIAGTAVLIGCVTAGIRQIQVWRNSETLYRHAIAVTTGNYAAYNNLGSALQNEGKLDEAVEYYKKAFQAFPHYADAHANLGFCYLQMKRPSDAMAEYLTAIALDANKPTPHYFLGNLLLQQARVAPAIEQYRIALSLVPENPDFHYQLGTALMAAGQIEESHREYRECLRVNPDRIEALNNFAWSLATDPDARWRDGGEALRLATRVVALTHATNAVMLDTLGVAYAEAGQFSEARETTRRAVDAAQAQSDRQIADEIAKRLPLYEKSQAYREPVSAGAVK